MSRQQIENEVLELEKQYWQAIKNRDADAVVRLTDHHCIITGAQGVRRLDKQALAGMMKSMRYTMLDFRISDSQVQIINDSVAIVAYDVHERLTVERKPVTVDAAGTSTWVRREGRWLCAVHTESDYR